MSVNSENIRGLYTAFAHGDVPGVLGALDKDIRWTEARGVPLRIEVYGEHARSRVCRVTATFSAVVVFAHPPL